MGVTGGFIAPYFVGYIKGLTGDFKAGFMVIAVFGLVVSALFYIIGSRQQRNRDAAGA
jgi:nitrate/nitrite transporter NarK